MKTLKRFAGLLMAVVMVFSLTTTAFAAGEGSITVNNTVKDADYTIYRIFDLESYSGNNYSYKVSEKWAAYFATGAEGLNYFTVENGYVTAKENINAAEFAQKALAYAEAQNIANDGTMKGNNSSIKFENLTLGYYLVDSSLGALCALTTTNPNGTVIEKNSAPSLDKTVQEDSNNQWGKTNDADIGQTVNFKATITVQGYAKDYVMHDKMDDGLTYKEVSSVTLNGSTTATSNYTVNTTGLTDGCTFEVVFTDDFCKTLKSGDEIVIFYTATVNENAVVAEPENNNAHLSYKDENGTSHETEDSNTKTYTWNVNIFKYAKDGDSEKALAGAVFTLSKNTTGSDPIKLVSEGENVYRVAKDTDTVTITQITTDSTGKFTIRGLDSDTYYLTEITAPDGYNKLSAPITIKIDDKGQVFKDSESVALAGKTVKIQNQSGTELPSTGGMGTTLFYAAGSALVLAAVVLLVTKKRMDSNG